MLKLWYEIVNFHQYHEEPWYGAWGRFKHTLLKCPNHEILEKMLIQIFYRALVILNKSIMDNSTSLSFINMPYGIASKFLDQVELLCRGLDRKDAKVAMGAPFSSFMHQEKREKKEIKRKIWSK